MGDIPAAGEAMTQDEEDMQDAEDRDAWGFQYRHGPITRPGRIDVRAPISGEFKPDNSIGKRVNEPLPWIASGMLIAGLAVALAFSAFRDADRAEREARMLEYYVLELDAKLIAAGYKTDAESLAKKLKQQRGEK